MRSTWFKLLIQLSIGIAILFWLLQLADVSKIYSVILSANPLTIFTSAIIFILASLFVALALYISLKPLNPDISMNKVIMASFAGQLLSDVTPARSGYFVTPLIISKLCNVSIEKGVVGVIVTGIANSFIKIILAVVGIVYFMKFLPLSSTFLNTLIIGIISLLIGSTILLIILLEKRVLKLKVVLEKTPIMKNITRKLIEIFSKIQDEGQRVMKVIHYVALLLLLSVITNSIALYLVHKALSYNSLDFINFVFMAAIVGCLMYVPVTIAGLGVQETGYVFLLVLLGESFEVAITFALIVRLLFTGTDVVGLHPLIKIGFEVMKQKSN